MLETYLLGAIGVAALAAGWLAVQLAWRRSFPAAGAEPDGLAGRDCASCWNAEHCEDRSHDRGGAS